MKIHCPCDMIAEPKLVNGVIEYVHKDGTSCKVLNRFYVDKCESYVWSICEQAIEDNSYDTFNIHMCIATSPVMKRLLKHVSFTNKQELIKVFMFLFSTTKIRGDLQAAIAKEIILEHGRIAYDNIRAVMGESFERNRALSSITYDKLKKTNMCNISSDIRITSNSTKQNIVEDLARSFLIDKSIRNSNLKQALSKLSR